MSNDIEGIRLIARGIADRAKTDSEFRERLRADARGTLVAEGLPEEAVPDFMHEAGPADVEAHAARPCGGLTCITSCDRTCLITSWP